MKMSRLSLADSALRAPRAGFGDVDLYPDFVDKAAVLLVRLAMNHPLPDGNKRAVWVSMRIFVAINDWSWDPHPDVDDAERTVMGIASGELDEAATAGWLNGSIWSHQQLPPDHPAPDFLIGVDAPTLNRQSGRVSRRSATPLAAVRRCA